MKVMIVSMIEEECEWSIEGEDIEDGGLSMYSDGIGDQTQKDCSMLFPFLPCLGFSLHIVFHSVQK